ncbi:hypothetical protein KQI18_07140 [Clostridioides mangenotii]|uniref:hypothetical protein n=1 Tax=Metaclostridioides mangenotii TaxID=1540 RepID=UPI001C10DB7A|nr:hypothetical protein [Clostridioides mangenotii]MBU5307559.1 hypothetical protein [Clostridioides mangenotii]
MKRVLLLTLLCAFTIVIAGCGSDEQDLALSKEEVKKIEDSLNLWTEDTAYENSKFKIQTDGNNLKIAVVTPIMDLMTHYNTITADETVKAIKKSLIFDDACDSIKEENIVNFDSMQIYIFNNEKDFDNNDWYTLKTVN